MFEPHFNIVFLGEGGSILSEPRFRGKYSKIKHTTCIFLNIFVQDCSWLRNWWAKHSYEALKGEQSDRWKEAMKCKYSSLIKNGMWELVPTPEGKNFVGSPWVLKVKHNEEGSMDRFEARLVAQGYSQVEGVDYKEVFSPVAHYTSVRSLLALANAHNLEIQSVHQIDVKLLFLCDSLDCDKLHVATRRICWSCQTKSCLQTEEGHLWTCKQSAHCWNTTLDEYLKSVGNCKSNADGSIYVKSGKEANACISSTKLGVYVNGIISVSTTLKCWEQRKLYYVKDLRWMIKERYII